MHIMASHMLASNLYLLLFIIPDVLANGSACNGTGCDGTVCDGGGCDESGGEDVVSGGTV